MKLSNAKEAAMMSVDVRHFLATKFPETSVDIAILVLLRIVVDTAVHTTSKEHAPILLSELINEFLLTDHYGRPQGD